MRNFPETELGSYCKYVAAQSGRHRVDSVSIKPKGKQHMCDKLELELAQAQARAEAHHNQSPLPDSGLSCRNMEILLALNLSLRNDLRAFSS